MTSGISIRRYYDDKVLYEAPSAVTIKDALEQAVSAGADLRDADLRDADLSGADLYGAYLYGADLYGADLSGADLYGANLYGANLYHADLSGADLYGAYLYGASLYHADLRGASLRDADLSDAILIDAHLYGASLYGAKLPTGEIWEEYLTQVVPALLTAGGKALAAVANDRTWACHTWRKQGAGSPIAEAFDANDLTGVPILLRPRAAQFIALFDAGLIQLEDVGSKPGRDD